MSKAHLFIIHSPIMHINLITMDIIKKGRYQEPTIVTLSEKRKGIEKSKPINPIIHIPVIIPGLF